MVINLKKYSNLKICVAVSGGKDSMALLHYLIKNAEKYNITLSALNCDHGMRKKTSARDSAFVITYCNIHGVPVTSFKARGFASEDKARLWRIDCYLQAAKFCDCVATAHHMDDNAETVLFNLARGTSLSGMEGITDLDLSHRAQKHFMLIRPLISCNREEIDDYISRNNIPFTEDETNFTDDYTRNKIRHNVLPELERAVNGATGAIYRFSRLAAEDEEYFSRQVSPLISQTFPEGYCIADCPEKVIFRRAAAKIVSDFYRRKDYTSAQLEKLFELQFLQVGKKFEFLGLTAQKEDNRLTICRSFQSCIAESIPVASLGEGILKYGQIPICLCGEGDLQTNLTKFEGMYPSFKLKILRFDGNKISPSAVLRLIKQGDRFTKFGGGGKKLGDFFTDKKIPARVRNFIPLICEGEEVLVVCGVEISEKVKTESGTKTTLYVVCPDFERV